MANPYDFVTIARGDLLHDPRGPENFLPTSLCHKDHKLSWTRPGYATYGTTPTNNDIQYSSCAVYCFKLEQNVILPPNLQKLASEADTPNYKKHYIAQYKNAAATIDHYHRTNIPNDHTFADAISNWKQTCDALTENPFFNDGWDLPAFFPFYDFACSTACANFFKNKIQENNPNNSRLWNKRHKHANEMLDAWKQFYLFISSPNHIPFPKCLWYHKYFIIHEQKEAEVWSNYFKNTNFSTWGNPE